MGYKITIETPEKISKSTLVDVHTCLAILLVLVETNARGDTGREAAKILKIAAKRAGGGRLSKKEVVQPVSDGKRKQLTDTQKSLAEDLIREGKLKAQEIAQEVGCNPGVIYMIKTRMKRDGDL